MAATAMISLLIMEATSLAVDTSSAIVSRERHLQDAAFSFTAPDGSAYLGPAAGETCGWNWDMSGKWRPACAGEAWQAATQLRRRQRGSGSAVAVVAARRCEEVQPQTAVPP